MLGEVESEGEMEGSTALSELVVMLGVAEKPADGKGPGWVVLWDVALWAVVLWDVVLWNVDMVLTGENAGGLGVPCEASRRECINVSGGADGNRLRPKTAKL